jgi:hypothetical protein
MASPLLSAGEAKQWVAIARLFEAKHTPQA